ncbi:hypothetical protein K438DRAFT_1980931 [Mycena galopus ATCC 62051]|nr:hypothetical protein K438DRAFT_1980931 [Mycena galopus ATCC 62051]
MSTRTPAAEPQTSSADTITVDLHPEVAMGDECSHAGLFLPTSRPPTSFKELEEMALEVMEPQPVAASMLRYPPYTPMLYSFPPHGIKRKCVVEDEDEDEDEDLADDKSDDMGHTLAVVEGKDRAVDDWDAEAVLSNTWACTVGGPAGGKLVIMLGERKYLYIPQTSQDDEEFTRSNNCPPCPDGYLICRPLTDPPYTRAEFILVDRPSDDELQPFRVKRNKYLLSIPCAWNTPALEVGDYVAVVSREFVSAGGEIAEMRRDGHHVWAEVWGIPPGGAETDEFRAEIYLEDLARHALGYAYEFQPKDHVHVVLRICYWDTEGRVVKIEDDILTIAVRTDTAVVGPCVPSEMDPDIKTFEVLIYNVTRQFYRGDWVEATRGKHKGRVFVIIDFSYNGIVGANATRDQLFDMKFVVKVPVVHVKFWHRYTANIIRRNDCDAESWNNMWKPVTKEAHKGFRGVVIGDHNRASRARCLGSSRDRGRWDQDGILLTIGHETCNARIENIDIDHFWHEFTNLKLSQARFLPAEILSGKKPSPNNVPKFQGSFPRPQTPPRPRTPTLPYTAPLWTAPDPLPTLDREETGQWISLPQLSMKRLDVKVVGIANIRKASCTISALEGKFGCLLITTPVSSGDPKVDVYGVGRNSLMQAVQRSCVKPQQVDDAGRSF